MSQNPKTGSLRFIPVLSWFLYVTVYFGRLNFSIAIPLLQNESGYSKTALGFLAAGFFAAYAAGQFINGIAGDRMKARYFISAGLAAAGISNLLFCIFPVFPVMFLAWTANGYFQSMIWGPMLRTIAECVPAEKLNRTKLFISTSPGTGYFCHPL